MLLAFSQLNDKNNSNNSINIDSYSFEACLPNINQLPDDFDLKKTMQFVFLQLKASLQDNRLESEVFSSAAACIERLMTILHEKEYKETNFELSKVLALVWMGVMNTENHLPDYPQNLLIVDLKQIPPLPFSALENFINELCNIQTKAYSGVYAEYSSCGNGSINGVVLSLNNIHNRVSIIMIDQSTITFTTP